MKRIKILIFISGFFMMFFPASKVLSQELQCMVNINHDQLQSTNTQLFQEMQRSIYEFMNNRKWTDHIFDVDEKIVCNLMINIKEQIGSEQFTGTVSVQYSRPIFNTAYNSSVLNYKEKDGEFRFEFTEGQPMDFSETSFISSLTSVLAFYAYIIIGLDYDTYAELGGTPYFQKALSIANNAQSSSYTGWKPYEHLENRYWLIENFLNPIYEPLRKCNYRYHRLGLDVMSERADAGRAEIAEALRFLTKVHNAKPNSFLMKLFFTAKSDEIVSIFSNSFDMEKSKVVNILKEIDGPNSVKYDQIMTAKKDQ